MSTTADVKRLFDVYIEAGQRKLDAYNHLVTVEHSPVETVSGAQSRAMDSAEAGDAYNEALRALVKVETALYCAIVNLPDEPPATTPESLQDARIVLPVRYEFGTIRDGAHNTVCTLAQAPFTASEETVGVERRRVYELRGQIIAALLNQAK